MKDNWLNVTIGEYQELVNITSEGIQRDVDIISILTDKDSDEIRKAPINQFFEWQKIIPFVMTTPDSFFNKTFELDGVEYGLVDDFVYKSAGEFIDIKMWMEDSVANMHSISAYMFRPIISKRSNEDYIIEDYSVNGFTRRAELFRDKLPITHVQGFFLRLLIVLMTYLSDTPISSEPTIKKMKPKKTKTMTQKKKPRRKPMKKSKGKRT